MALCVKGTMINRMEMICLNVKIPESPYKFKTTNLISIKDDWIKNHVTDQPKGSCITFGPLESTHSMTYYAV